MKKWICVFAGIVLLMGCATTQKGDMTAETSSQAGFLKGYYDKLGPGPEGGAKQRWLNPEADWGRYNYVMLDSVVFFFDDASEYKGIDPHELKELADQFNQALVEALKAHYPIKTEPGIDVLRIRFAITDLEQSHPGLSAVSTVVPVGLAVSTFKRGATGSWAGSGATAAEMMAVDSMSNDVLAVAKDEQAAGFTERFSKWGSAEEAFTFWAERIRGFLDGVQGR